MDPPRCHPVSCSSDVQAQNILLSQHQDQVVLKLSDFGCWRAAADCEDGEERPPLVGTALWMAPEVCRQAGRGLPSDIWSLGCTILEMATAKDPWYPLEFDNPVSAIFHIAHAAAGPCLHGPVAEHFSPEAQEFISGCLRPDLRERPTAMALSAHPWVVWSPDLPPPAMPITCEPPSAEVGPLSAGRARSPSALPARDRPPASSSSSGDVRWTAPAVSPAGSLAPTPPRSSVSSSLPSNEAFQYDGPVHVTQLVRSPTFFCLSQMPDLGDTEGTRQTGPAARRRAPPVQLVHF